MFAYDIVDDKTEGKEINIKLSRKDVMNLVMLRYGKRKRDLNKKKTR